MKNKSWTIIYESKNKEEQDELSKEELDDIFKKLDLWKNRFLFKC